MNENVIENIYKASLKFLVPLSLEETYRIIVQEAIVLVEGEGGNILLRRNGQFERVYASSSAASFVKVRDKGFSYETYKTQKARVVNKKELEKTHPSLTKQGISSTIFIPLIYKSKALGVLIVRSKNNKRFSEKELGVLKLFGSMASVAIRKSQLYEETRDALEMRDLFISMASHELRTPITTISGYTDLIRKKIENGTPIQPKWVQSMYRENKRLIYLVNELLEINQIKTGKLSYDFKECNVAAVVKTAISNFKIQYPHRKIELVNQLVDGSGKIIGDKEKILQVLENTMMNAVKFSGENEPIQIILELKGKVLTIAIKDRGKGIKKNKLDKIFQKYYKEETNKEGMGLGLFLVKEIMDKHKGAIKIKSKENKGTEIRLSFPKVQYE
jgi:signal transduction histidine kinase